MAIAVNGGHVSRALDFYEEENKYIIIGGTEAWEDEPTPTDPVAGDYKLNGVVGLRKVERTLLVVPDDNGTISYRTQRYRVVSTRVTTTVVSPGVATGSKQVPVDSVENLLVGSKIRINNQYEGVIQSIDNGTKVLTIDTAAPSTIAAGSTVEGGAFVEGAKYVYLDGHLEYDEFPIATYRQIGICSGVVPVDPDDADILRSADYNPAGVDEYSSLGVLEILDNKEPVHRDMNMRELISMIIEF